VHKCLKSFVIPLVACEAVIILSVGLIYSYSARGHSPFDLLAAKPLASMLLIGLDISLVCLPLCRLIRPAWGTLVGFSVGLVVPVVTGWASGYMISCYPWALWIFHMTKFEAWIGGLAMSIPGGPAGAVAGFLLAKRTRTASVPLSHGG